MGMYNIVYFDDQLNGPVSRDGLYQTKSMFACNMDTYYIGEDRKLYKRDFWDDTDSVGDFYSRCIDWCRNNTDKMTHVIASGCMFFYSEDDKENWIEYIAEINMGHVNSVILIRYGKKMLYQMI